MNKQRAKRIVWTAEEIESIAGQFRLKFPGEEILAWRIKEAQAVLPIERRRKFFNTATLRTVGAAVRGVTIPRKAGRRKMITRQDVDLALEHPATEIARPPSNIPQGGSLAEEIIAATIDANIRALTSGLKYFTELAQGLGPRA